MMRLLVVGGLMAMACGGLALADDKALKDLEGTYKVVAVEKGGKMPPNADELKGKIKVTFKGDTLTIAHDGQEKSGTIKVDGSKKPATMDITPGDGPEKGRTFPGIYKLEKGELTIVFIERGTDRPKDFKSDDGATLLRLKKE